MEGRLADVMQSSARMLDICPVFLYFDMNMANSFLPGRRRAG